MCYLMDPKKVKPSSVDVISSFPDEILAKILSFLPTKRAACTSVLSKRWKNLYPLMTHLFASQHLFFFDDSDLVYPEEEEDSDKNSFMVFVNKTLSGSNSIKNLSLKFKDGISRYDEWIRNNNSRIPFRLRETGYYAAFMLPRTRLLTTNVFTIKTLVKLTLQLELGGRIQYYPKLMFFPVLNSLFLHTHWHVGIEFCRKMLPCCPILEELSIHQLCGDIDENTKFLISHNTLKRLTVECYTNDHFFMNFDTPSLVYLDYSGLYPYRRSSANFLDSLVEAKLDVKHGDGRDLAPIIDSVCNVKTLSLSRAFTKVMSSYHEVLPTFINLVKLSFESDIKEGWDVLPRLLNKSPKLETLVLKRLYHIRKKKISFDRNGVKVLEIFRFRGNANEFRQVKYFLRKMHLLQVMKLEIGACDFDDNKKLQLMNHIRALPKSSSKCQIKFL